MKNLEVTPLVPDYAGLPITEAFDWRNIINTAKAARELDGSPLYVVAFRSVLKEDADVEVLLEHDRRAHEAALESPALIHYFGGAPNAARQALSFCLWENAESAKIISRDHRHREAIKMVSSYTSYSIEKYNALLVGDDVRLEPVY